LCILSDLGPLASDLGRRTSDVGPRTSNLGCRTSDVGPRPSNLGRRTSAVGPRTSVLDLPSRARAAVHQPLRGEHRQRLAVLSLSFALTHNGGAGAVAEPLEILEDAGVIVRAATLAIVILDANQHPGARAPHVLGVQHVPEMEPAGGGGCEAREHGA